jgi:VWFA-related protein
MVLAAGVFLLPAVQSQSGSATSARTQDPPASQNPPTFHAGVNLIELDVSVFDRDRRPVTGLTAADFTVLDDGQPRKVAAFSSVTLPDSHAETGAATASWIRTTVPDVTSNQLAGRRLVTIVIDELILPEQSAVPDVMQRLARTIIDQLGPADLASVTYLYYNNLGQEFTADPATLDQAVDRLQPVFPLPGSPGPMPLTTSGSYVDVIGALAKLTGTLADVPHRRKIVFFIGTGLGINAGLQERDALYGAAQGASVDFYCLDAAGLQVAGGANVLLELAHNTGGEAVKDTNTPWKAVPAIFRENQSYYLLGFEPDPAIPAGRSRRLEVKVDRPGVEVRTKSRYTTPSPSEVVAEPTLDGPLPVGDLLLQISALPVAAQATDSTPVLVALTVGEPSVRTDVLQVDVRSYTADDVQEMAGRESVRAVPQAAPGESRQVTVFARVDLKPGRHLIRAAVRSAALKRAGSVFTNVEVPDFGKARLALSGVVLHSDQAEAFGGTETLADLVPRAPTNRRTLAATERVWASLAIYQGGSAPPGPVTLSTQITNDHDQTVFGRTETFAADRFGAFGHHAESMLSVPLDRLPAGRYLLSFQATTATDTAERDVQFAVK